MRLSPEKEQLFPLLKLDGYEVTSPETFDYNCIAFAANVLTEWWWPDQHGDAFWPNCAPREETREAFVKAYESIGYELCADDSLEAGYEKLAIYEKSGIPTHAAKQLQDGRWKSKLGPSEDIEHNTIKGIESSGKLGIYGEAKVFMKRPMAGQHAKARKSFRHLVGILQGFGRGLTTRGKR